MALSIVTIVFTIVGSAFLVVGLNVRAAMAHGESGVFTPRTQACHERSRSTDNGTEYYWSCSWDGEFRNENTVLEDAHIGNDLDTGRGAPAPAPVDAVLGSDGNVYLDNAMSWGLWLILGGVFLPIGLGIGGASLAVARKRRRRTAISVPPVDTPNLPEWYSS